MRKYETIIVIDSLLKLEEIEGIINKYERFISANGGQIEAIDRWGKRRLAYEIKKRQYGFYVLIRYDAPPAMIKQLDREFRLNEFLLRTMTTLLNKRALKALAKQYVAAKPAVDEPSAAAVETAPAAADAAPVEAAETSLPAEEEAPGLTDTVEENAGQPDAVEETDHQTDTEAAGKEPTPAAE